MTTSLITHDESCDGVDITAVTKLKHAALWAASKKLGSQSALANHLSVRPDIIGRWINLKSCPPEGPIEGSKWTKEYILELEAKLKVLTGLSWFELFPESLRKSVKFRDCSKTIERTARLTNDALEHYATKTRQRLEDQANGVDKAQQGEMRDAIEKVMRSLSYREREIIKLRFGLGDGLSHTLEEIGQIFRINKERVRQIEWKAIRKLQQPTKAAVIEEFVN